METGLHISLASERVFDLWGVPITNSIIATWAIFLLFFLVVFLVRRNLSLVPGRLQNAAEWAVEFVYGYVEQMFGDEKLAKRYFPLIATIFFFVLTVNLLEFFPLFGTVGVNEGGALVPLFHTATADLNLTLALALITFFTVEFSGVVALGLLKYGSKFVNFKAGPMGFAIGLLEIIGNLARLISLSFRLFGAIFAGEVLVMVVRYFVPYIASVPLMAFEMFVGVLQAAIFAILTLAYLKLAFEEPHGSHDEAHAAH